MRIDLGDDVGGGVAARRAERPFGVRGDGQTARAPGEILDPEPGDLDRILKRHKLQQLERYAVRRALEAAVALAVAHRKLTLTVIDRRGCRRPQLPRFRILHVQNFARPIGDRII